MSPRNRVRNAILLVLILLPALAVRAESDCAALLAAQGEIVKLAKLFSEVQSAAAVNTQFDMNLIGKNLIYEKALEEATQTTGLSIPQLQAAVRSKIRISHDLSADVGTQQTVRKVLQKQTAAFEQQEAADVCGRQKVVVEAILHSLDMQDCAQVTRQNLLSIRELYLSKGRLKRISYKDLKGLLNLEVLNLSENQLTTIEKGTFADLDHLEKVFLTDNEIQDLTPDMVDELKNVKLLHLSLNPLSGLPTGKFTAFSKLKELIMLECGIQEIPEGFFAGLHNLETLGLSGNKLQNVKASIFKDTPNLTHLTLSDNPFISIEEDSFFGLPKIKFLSLAYGSFTSLPPLLLSRLPMLTQIQLGFGKFETLPKGFFDYNLDLKILDLQYGVMANLPDDFFPSFRPKIIIRMYGNTFKNIRAEWFRRLKYDADITVSAGTVRFGDAGISELRRAGVQFLEEY